MRRTHDVKKIIHAFYADYARWLDAGATSLEFCRSTGLCANLGAYCSERFPVQGLGACDVLAEAFIAAGLDEDFPFNSGPDDYLLEAEQSACHLNPARVKWVRSRVSSKGRS